MNIRAVIFDADGVLIDSRDLACEVFNELAIAKCPTLPRFLGQKQLSTVFRGPLWEALVPYGLQEAQGREFFEAHATEMRRRSIRIETFKIPITAACKTTLRCGIVSSSYEKTIHEVLARCTSYKPSAFHKIVGRDGQGTKAEKIRLLLEEMRVHPEHAIYIGDMASDIVHAREAGVLAGVVAYGYHTKEHLMTCGPDILFSTQAEVARFLDNGITRS